MDNEIKKKLVLVDANALVHRAFHALPPLSKDGFQTGAIYGTCSVILKGLNEIKPDYIIAAFDLPEPTFRHLEFEEYKITRPKAPEELYEQIPKVKPLLQALGVIILEAKGFEADDVIGTVAEKVKKDKNIEVIILTGDLDTLQLVDENVRVYTFKKGLSDIVVYDLEKVKERFEGLDPSQLADYKGLKGDPSDNIPGVKGVGEKTTISLLKEYRSLENLYQEIEKPDFKPTKIISQNLKEKLLEEKDMAFFSKKLGTIIRDIDLDFYLEQSSWQGNYNQKEAEKLFKAFGFTSLIKRLPSMKSEVIQESFL